MWLARTDARDPTPENLSQYLLGIRNEDWGSEFKTAASTDRGTYQIRKAIASLGNHEGGEVFLGVRDSNRALDGTTIAKEELPRHLRQHGAQDDWYSIDLAPLAAWTTPVPLPEGHKRVLVVEVRKGLLPSMVVEDEGDLTWYERRANTDHALTGVEGVNARRRFAQGQLLLELYHEFRDAVLTLPDQPAGWAPNGPDHFALPRFEAARSSGEIYSVLSEEQQHYLVAQEPGSPTGFAVPGVLGRFVEAGRRVKRDVERHARATQGRLWENWDVEAGNTIRIEREGQRHEVEQVASWLRALGVLPRE